VVIELPKHEHQQSKLKLEKGIFKFRSSSSKGGRSKRSLKEEGRMKQNMMALLIGVIGATLTLFAYSQTFISPSQCITIGLVVLMLGLLVGEGLISF